MGNAAVECLQLGRVFSGGSRRRVVALDDLSLAIPRGVAFGLLGPNGAGKTTTIRILATLLTPTSGGASVLGHDVVREPKEVRRRMGFMLGGERGLYTRLTGRENLTYFASINYLESRVIRRRVTELLARVGLADRADRLVAQYSRGMMQRLHIARSMLTDPELLIMDEPTIGLDPEGAFELRRLIPELVGEGKTVLLTTHNLAEADEVCQLIALINQGRLIAMGTPAQIRAHVGERQVLELNVELGTPDLLEAIEQWEGTEHTTVTETGVGRRYAVRTLARDAEAFRSFALGLAGTKVRGYSVRDLTLEEAYFLIMQSQTGTARDAT